MDSNKQKETLKESIKFSYKFEPKRHPYTPIIIGRVVSDSSGRGKRLALVPATTKVR